MPASTRASAITTRANLTDALQEASELEHGLMLQYLFAALSLKQRMAEGLTAAQEELVRTWKGTLLGIAREEMTHLGSVCNLLAAIGGAPVVAVDFIIEQGEGARRSAPGRTTAAFSPCAATSPRKATLTPRSTARNVVGNPRTRAHRDAPIGGTQLTNRYTIAFVEFFNDTYEVVLLLLAQLCSYGGETLGERTAIRDAARQLMTLAIRPAAEMITELPATPANDGLRAGPAPPSSSTVRFSSRRRPPTAGRF